MPPSAKVMFDLTTAVMALVACYSLSLTLYLFLLTLLLCSREDKEPTTIATTIPFITPMIGLITQKLDYFVFLRDKYRLPIYTLRLPGIRIYVVNSTALIPAVQKPYRTLAWYPIVIQVASRVMALSKPTLRILRQDLEGKAEFLAGLHKAMHLSLSPGTSALDKMSENAVAIFTSFLDDSENAQRTNKARLYDWLGHRTILTITEAVFGPRCPFKDPKIEAAYKIWEPDFISMWLGIAPFVARRCLRAREDLVNAFRHYYEQDGFRDDGAAALIRHRYEFYVSYGIPTREIAQIEVALIFTLLGNARPLMYWLVWHIMSDSCLLRDCRRELSEALSEGEGGVATLNMAFIKETCPILFSTYQEVLRFHGINISVREIVDDYHLEGRYHLKKGNYLLTPAAVQHSSTENWGDNVHQFYARRFVRGERRYNHTAFRGWGSGTNLCPGRHFASTALLAFTAMLISRFDIRPLSGVWVMPTSRNANAATAVAQPDQDMDVVLIPRRGRAWSATYVSNKTP